MTPLRVLLPLTLLVAVTLAAFPSSNQIGYYGKESSGESDILWPGNPAIENIFGNDTPVNKPSEGEKKDEIKVPASENPSKGEKKDEIKTPVSENPSKDEKKDEIKVPVSENPSKDVKKDESKVPPSENPSKGEKKDEIKTPVSENPSKDVKKDESKVPPSENPSKGEDKGEIKKPDEENPSKSTDKKTSANNTVAAVSSDYRLSDYIVPQRYSIELSLNHEVLLSADSKYDGTVEITFKSTLDKNRVIRFHYDRKLIVISSMSLLETQKRTTIEFEEIPQKDSTATICELKTKQDLAVDTEYTLTLKYVGTVNDGSRGFYKGSYFNSKGELRWYAVTHFEPMGARSAFPCLDEPALKATFDIKITHSNGYNAISNMVVDKTADKGAGWTETVFKTTPKMSTYLVAFAITDFAKTGTNVKVYSRKEAEDMSKYAAELGDKILKELEFFTGIKYNLEKMDQIALPLLRPGAMENWGLVTYRENAILYDPNRNATIDQQKVASIIAHEFAHQWFGNLVSPKWWQYIWLNEGFATYFQYYTADKVNPEWRFMEQFNSAALQGTAFAYDSDLTKTRAMNHEESKESEINDLFDSIAYQKAGSVIRMFAHVLGEEKFKKGLNKYLSKKEFDSATSEDLFKAFDEVVDKKILPEDVTVEKIFNTWATKKGYPVVTVTKNKDTLVLNQEPFYLMKNKNEELKADWYVPVNFVQDSEKPDFEDTAVTHWLQPGSDLKISNGVSANGWVIVNKQQTGYYRVNYDKENWQALANYLKSENFTKIHPLSRSQLIDDALNLAKAGKLDYSVALDLFDYLNQETDYIVWKSAFGVLSSLNKLLATTEYYDQFAKYLVSLTETLLDNVSIQPIANETYVTKLLRVDAIKWACNYGSVPCRTYASTQVDAWLADKNENATLPRDLDKILLCCALKTATFEQWNRLFLKYVTSFNTDEKELIFSALGCSSSPEILEYFLNVTVVPNSIFKGNFLQIFQGIYTNSPIGVTVVLDFVHKNVHKLRAYDTNYMDNIEKYVNELGSRIALKSDLQKLNEIVQEVGLTAEKTQRALDIATFNNKWLEDNGKTINNFFVEKNIVTTPLPIETTTKGGAGSLSLTTLLLAAPLALLRLR